MRRHPGRGGTNRGWYADRSPDADLLEYVQEMTYELEVSARSRAEWAHAIRTGLASARESALPLRAGRQTLHLMERATSVYILNIISTDPAWVPSGDLADGALLVFRQHLAGADDVTAEFLDGIQFVDQGENFESVSCPQCGELLDDGWWAERMDDSWSPDLNAFADLQVVTPCCGANSSLNDLDYEWPAGFASFRLQATNPSRGGFLPDAELEEIAATLGSPLRQVYAHY